MRIASIATYRDRLEVLPDAINSLAPQVDLVQIYFNGELGWGEFRTLGEKLNHKNWKLNIVEDQADLSKFNAIFDYPEDIIFLCDDDLIYRDRYISRMERCLLHSQFIGSDVISLGGKVLKEGDELMNANNYKACCSKRYGCFMPNPEIVFSNTLDIPLSGATVLQAKHFQDCVIDPKYKYAADIQLFKWCRDKDLLIKRAFNCNKRLASYSPKMKGKETIFNSFTQPKADHVAKLIKEIFTGQI